MPLPASGPISFSQIRTEMNSGNSGAISMSSLYSNGSLGSRGVTGIPASGAVPLSVFWENEEIPYQVDSLRNILEIVGTVLPSPMKLEAVIIPLRLVAPLVQPQKPIHLLR